jgi:hypothetical protein
MAMTSCNECARDISDKALTCPGCGAPNNSPRELSPEEALMMIDNKSHSPVAPSGEKQQIEYSLKRSVTDPLLREQRRASRERKEASSGGAAGALIGATLGYFMVAVGCNHIEKIGSSQEFIMSLIVSSPLIVLGMLLGYFFGKSLGR